MNTRKNILFKIRALLMRLLVPSNSYWIATKTTKPISVKFGFDRGTPIDRYWIEDFLGKNKTTIKGNCLEITDNTYTKKFGKDNITNSDVLDINKSNNNANIYGDLRNLNKTIKSNTYDCIILTHVLGLINDVESAISECHRILKPNGVLLATSSCLSPTYDITSNYWRFTPQGAKYLFEKYFSKSNLEIVSYGNVLTGQCFWVGMSQEDLTPEQLQYNDPKFPCVVGIKAIKNEVQHE